MNHRAMRLEELRLAAGVARSDAQNQRALHVGPMSSRERRILHLALRDELDLKTESTVPRDNAQWWSIQKILNRFSAEARR